MSFLDSSSYLSSFCGKVAAILTRYENFSNFDRSLGAGSPASPFPAFLSDISRCSHIIPDTANFIERFSSAVTVTDPDTASCHCNGSPFIHKAVILPLQSLRHQAHSEVFPQRIAPFLLLGRLLTELPAVFLSLSRQNTCVRFFHAFFPVATRRAESAGPKEMNSGTWSLQLKPSFT